MMAREIGKEWEEWAQRVKYRLIRTGAFISAVFVQLQSHRLGLPELTTCINHRM
jgi:hypothetical protein